MKENINLQELKILDFWKEIDLFKLVNEKNKDGKLFTFVDGPPYPTGEAHLGHLRVWSIKDAILRFRRQLGYNVYARDGYDVHGLPVENKTQAKLNLKTTEDLKRFGEENFVKECRKYALEVVEDMAKVRDRFALLTDRNYYHTSHPEYLSLAWRFFKIADEKNLLYKDYKTVAWCPHDETTLSDYEIKDTYKTLEDPSIYVKFPIKKNDRKSTYPESLLIWTTTPWTLQSNMAIAVNPDFDYAYVLVEIGGKEEVLIIAKNLVEGVVDKLSKSVDIKFIEILKTVKGQELEGIGYEHIYLDETPSQKEFVENGDIKFLHSVVVADYVSLGEGESILDKLEKKGSYKHSNVSSEEKLEEKSEKEKNETSSSSEGTGLVHIAPGHGFDDYEVGKRYNLPIFCPVGSDGKFTEGKYEGMYFKDVDKIAIDYLKEKGVLLHFAVKSHRYPCCWRCKTPILYRAADQWWIKRSEIVDGVLKENEKVRWHPDFARNVFSNLYSNVGDWPISRQRYWGIPLPIFEDEDGNYEVFGSKEELEERIGQKLDDIHRDNLKNLEIVNKKSGKVMKAVPFITDVWFESGCASFASHYGEGLSYEQIIEKYYPMSWVIEGQDQIRGWFSSLFSVGYLMTGKAPYKNVEYMQFVMDKYGKKMSKSLGNGISGNEAIEKWGTDKTRYYLLSKRPAYEQINFDEEDFNLVGGFFNTLENVTRFMNSYLKDYEIKDFGINYSNLDIEDLWILYKLNKTIEQFTFNMEKYQINVALNVLEDFIVRDLSKTYLKIVKERCEGRDDNLIMIFKKVLKDTLILLSSSIPIISERLYGESELFNKKKSIFLEDLPVVDGLLIKDVEQKGIGEFFELSQEIIAAILNAREKAKIGVRWPLGKVDIVSTKNLKDNLKPFEKLIKSLTNIVNIGYDANDVSLNYIIKPNFAFLKQDFDDVSKVIKAINLNKFYIGEDLKAGKKVGVYEDVELDLERHILKEVELDGDYISSEFSEGNVILHTAQDEILLEGGYLRELIRRVQQARKDFGFEKSELVKLSFAGSDETFLEIAKNWGGVISKKVGASEILENELAEKKEFEIKGKKLVVSLEKENNN